MAEVGPPVILSLGIAGYCSVRRTLRRVSLRLLLAALVTGAWDLAAIDSAPAIGMYEVRVCEGPCPVDGPAEIHGTLMLFAAPPDLEALPPDDRADLEELSTFLLYPDKQPNACFVLQSSEATKMLAGLTPVGLTTWHYQDGVLTVPLYRSPDASSIGFAIPNGERLGGGVPEERRLRESTPYHRVFIDGRRVGEADLRLCVLAARREMGR